MISLIALMVVGCASSEPSAVTTVSASSSGPPIEQVPIVEAKPTVDVKRVLVVVNMLSPDSIEVGDYYVKRRGIPEKNVFRVKTHPKELIEESGFRKSVLEPLRAELKSRPEIDFIVTTRGIPLRLDDSEKQSCDAMIAAMNLGLPTLPTSTGADFKRNLSPYYNKREPFVSKKFNMWLVTRLDGYSVADAKRLVDLSIASKPQKGLFLMDGDPTKDNERYSRLPASMRQAAKQLGDGAFQTKFEDDRGFLGSSEKLMGYVSWGSNEGSFDRSTYKSLRFHPGAIAETFVSTSARRLREDPNDRGQSLISDLIASGVTGIKGYVTEPFTVSLARPDILFERYVAGFNLAESFYMASPLVNYKCVVIGDPLCAPYAKAR